MKCKPQAANCGSMEQCLWPMQTSCDSECLISGKPLMRMFIRSALLVEDGNLLKVKDYIIAFS